MAKGSSFSITREKFEDQPYRIIATKESSQVAKELRKATEESSPRKPPEYESVTVASLSNLMEQCLQESLNIFEHLKKEEGMEYDMGNVQSVAQTIFQILNLKKSKYSRSKKIKSASKKNIQAMSNLCIKHLEEINFFKPKEKKPKMLEKDPRRPE